MRDLLIRVVKKRYRFLSDQKFVNPNCVKNRQIANNHIYNLFSSNAPCMISRFGTTELSTINSYLCIKEEIPYL
jgi:hypothetical protein